MKVEGCLKTATSGGHQQLQLYKFPYRQLKLDYPFWNVLFLWIQPSNVYILYSSCSFPLIGYYKYNVDIWLFLEVLGT